MSGIAGVFQLDGAGVEPGALDPAIAAQAERGRDGTDQWSQGPIAVAQMWWRTSPGGAVGGGPFVLADGGPVVVGDVRLDDREALLGALGLLQGSRERPVGDLELLARGYARWGADLARRLLGDFAFAIWDPKAGTLLCARDAFGVRPFVYHAGSGRFSFASRPAAVLGFPWVPRQVDQLAVARYLIDDPSDTEGTFWEGVRRLRPGHLLTVSSRGAGKPRPFFTFDPEASAPVGSADQHAEAFRERFLQAVRWRLATDLPLGVEVSGGLDSASVAGAARFLGAPQPIPAYTINFADPSADERRFVADVLGAGGLRGVAVGEDELVPGGRIRDLPGDTDSPYTLGGPLMESAILRRAAAEGTGVLLSGFDGDTVVSHGVGHLTDLAAGGRIGGLAHELRAARGTLGWGPWTTLRSQVISPLAPPWVHQVRGRLKGSAERAGDPLAGSLIDRDFARRVGLLDAPAPGPSAAGRRPFARWEHWADLTAGVNAATLELLDHAGARAGVEFRHPFFDRSLAQLTLSLPGEVKFRDGWTRWVQRAGVHGLAPDSVRWRPDKAVLGPMFSATFLATEWDEATRIARDGGGAAAGFVDAGALRAAYRQAASSGSNEDSGTIWLILLLERWLERVM